MFRSACRLCDCLCIHASKSFISLIFWPLTPIPSNQQWCEAAPRCILAPTPHFWTDMPHAQSSSHASDLRDNFVIAFACMPQKPAFLPFSKCVPNWLASRLRHESIDVHLELRRMTFSSQWVPMMSSDVTETSKLQM